MAKERTHVLYWRKALKGSHCLVVTSRSHFHWSRLIHIMTTATVTYHELPPLTSWASDGQQTTHNNILNDRSPSILNPLITPQQFICNQSINPYRTGALCIFLYFILFFRYFLKLANKYYLFFMFFVFFFLKFPFYF